ncbi:LysR family transcriptional regulator, glycine cleavage system transcriptional activator [Rhizobiales bacterium GAS191]|nr:LysR family transcriptional regulator, glycine cleavage system transcriptional activator [Rhizobiales bacterium GAS191]
MRHLPSLSGLRSFEATARHASMTKAAEELGVTQGAISRAVQALEADLGCPLLRRSRPKLFLTEIGHLLYSEINHSFDRVAVVIGRVREQQRGGQLAINSLPTFAARYLIPRLPRFQARHPEMQVDLTTSENRIDFAVESIDVAIRYGLGNWSQTASMRLMDEELVAVCAPELLARHGGELGPGTIDPRQLLRHTTRMAAWDEWLKAAGADASIEPRGPGFEHFFMVIEAAVSGMGFALLPRFLIARELADGSLVIASRQELLRQQAYYLLFATERRFDPKIVALIRWLKDEVALDQGAVRPSAAPSLPALLRAPHREC